MRRWTIYEPHCVCVCVYACMSAWCIHVGVLTEVTTCVHACRCMMHVCACVHTYVLVCVLTQVTCVHTRSHVRANSATTCVHTRSHVRANSSDNMCARTCVRVRANSSGDMLPDMPMGWCVCISWVLCVLTALRAGVNWLQVWIKS